MFAPPLTQGVAAFFDAVAKAAYGSRFRWSPYNQSQWAKYCSGNESYGGACAFSLESDGEVPRTKGLGVCGPTGRFPDHVWDLTGHVGGARLREAVAQMGRFSLEGIG
jgi:hypothetical protein